MQERARQQHGPTRQERQHSTTITLPRLEDHPKKVSVYVDNKLWGELPIENKQAYILLKYCASDSAYQQMKDKIKQFEIFFSNLLPSSRVSQVTRDTINITSISEISYDDALNRLYINSGGCKLQFPYSSSRPETPLQESSVDPNTDIQRTVGASSPLPPLADRLEFDCNLKTTLCVLQWGALGAQVNHWCRLASFLTIAAQFDSSKAILESEGLVVGIPLDDQKNKQFVQECITIKRKVNLPRIRPTPQLNFEKLDTTRFEEEDIEKLNKEWGLGLKISKPVSLVPVLAQPIEAQDDKMYAHQIRCAIAEEFSKYYDPEKQKIMILGFEGLINRSLNHYCVLNKIDRNEFTIFDPILPPPPFPSVDFVCPPRGSLPNTGRKGARLTTGTVAGDESDKNVGILIKYYVIEKI
jgi:hypothetical protein